jgi:hypothetical protein
MEILYLKNVGCRLLKLYGNRRCHWACTIIRPICTPQQTPPAVRVKLLDFLVCVDFEIEKNDVTEKCLRLR